MKQTNNAIKFLLSQYRAIYKHAFIQGVLSASVLSLGLGLASSTAQATTINPSGDTTITDRLFIQSGSAAIESTGSLYIKNPKYTNHHISTNASFDGGLHLNGAPKITSGKPALDANSDQHEVQPSNATHLVLGAIKGSNNVASTSFKFKGESSISKNNILFVHGGTKDNASKTEADFNRLAVSGVLAIGAKSGDALVTYNDLELKENSLVHLGLISEDHKNNHGESIMGRSFVDEQGASVTTLNKNSEIFFRDNDVAKTELRGQVVSNQGRFVFGQSRHDNDTSGGGTVSAVTEFEDNIQAKGIVLDTIVREKSSAVFKTEAKKQEKVVTARGIFHYGSGSFINLAASSSANSGAVLSLDKNADNIGTLMILDQGVTLTSLLDTGSSASIGAIKIVGSGTNSFNNLARSTLQIDATTLTDFLKAGDSYTIPSTNTTKQDLAGGILLGDNGELKIASSDSEITIDLAGATKTNKDHKIVGFDVVSGTSATASKISLSGQGIISSNNLLVSTKLDDNLDSKLTIEANNLTLGSSGFTSSSSDFKMKEAIVHNSLNLVAGSSEQNIFTLQDKVTFESLRNGSYYLKDANGLNQKDKIAEAKEAIIGADASLATGSSLIFKGGHWITAKNITLSGGSLEVQSSAGSTHSSGVIDNGNYAHLSLKGKLAIKDGTLKVTGAKGANAILDLSQIDSASFDKTGASSSISLSGTSTKIFASTNDTTELGSAGYGVLKVDASSFLTPFLETAGNQTKLDINKDGVLLVSSPNTGGYDVSKFESKTSGTGSSGAINFVSGQEGFLVFDGTGYLKTGSETEQGKALDIGSGHIIADSLILTNNYQVADDSPNASEGAKKNDKFTIASGKYTLSQGLSSTSDLVLGGAKKVVMNFKGDTGSIQANLFLLDSTNTNASLLNFEYGVWQAQEITLGNLSNASKTTLQVGNGLNKTALSINNLQGAQNNQVKIADLASLTVQTADLKQTSFDIAGSMTLTGLEQNLTETDKFYNQGLAGVNLNGSTINIEKNGVMLIDRNILNAKDAQGQSAFTSTTSGEGENLSYAITLNDALNAKYQVKAGAELVFNFAQNAFGDKGLSAKEAAAFKQALKAQGSTLDGILNLGDVKLNLIWSNKEETEITWNNVKDFADIKTSDLTTNQLKQAKVTEVTNTGLGGQFGSLQAANSVNEGTTLSAQNKLGLHNAAQVGANKYYAFKQTSENTAHAMSIDTQHQLILAGGGHIGAVTVKGDDLLVQGGGETVFEGNVLVTQTGSDDSTAFSIDAQSKAIAQKDVTADALSIQGNLNVANKLTVNNSANLHTGSVVEAKTVQFVQDATIMGKLDAQESIALSKADMLIADGQVTTKKLEAKGQNIFVGYDTVAEVLDDTSTIFDESQSYSGRLEVQDLSLGGGTLSVDPDYSQATALASIKNLSGKNKDELDGNIYLGANSAIGLGLDNLNALEQKISTYQDNKQNLSPELGSMLYLNKKTIVQADKGITLTAQDVSSFVEYFNANNGTQADLVKDATGKYQLTQANTLYLGANTAIVVQADLVNKAEAGPSMQGIIHFAKEGKVIADGGEILIDGNVRANNTKYQMFSGGQDFKLAHLDGSAYSTDSNKAINVSTSNNFLYGVVEQDGSFALTVNADRAVMRGASHPVYDTLVAYAQGYNGEADEQGNIAEEQKLYFGTKKEQQGDKEVIVKNYAGYYNKFLQETIAHGDGVAVEQVARLGTYAGVVQSALTSNTSTTDSIASRMGLGVQYSDVNFATNGANSALWLNPIYKNHDAKGFAAQGLNYGHDLDLYGLALGADHTLSNGLRLGLMFNVGSGDADGKQAAQGVKNDFDYYGFAAYTGLSLNNFSIVGDLSYTVVDNEVSGNNAIEKVHTSLDSSALSLGVTGQYKLAFNGLDIVPHAGLRFTSIDLDDYTIKANNQDIAKYDTDRLNIFSIPVGVAIAKDIVAGEWIIKPSFDLTLTGNFGDDTQDGVVSWAGVENLTTKTSTEVIDSFTYKASLGIVAQSGNLSLGLGTSYTGSSNTDSYGINANAHFVF